MQTTILLILVIFFALVALIISIYFYIYRQSVNQKNNESKIDDSNTGCTTEENRQIIENAPLAIFMQKDFKFSYLNKAAIELFGANDKDELLGKPVLERVHPDFRNICSQRIANIYDNKTIASHIEAKYLKMDGSIVDVEASGIPFTIESSAGAMLFVRDISSFKKTEEELIQAKNKAEESERLKTAFLANMSHEIRTPMNGIIGFSQFLTNPELSADDRNRYADILNKSCNRLLNTVNDILDISILDSGQMQVFEDIYSPNKLILDLFEYYRKDFENKDVLFSYSVDPRIIDLELDGDEQKVRQILNNLLDNALKFVKKGSVTFGCLLSDGYIHYFVQDTGVGIAKEKQEFVFGRFNQEDYSLSRGFEGMGLGLTICKGLAEIMNGEISLESELNQGASFTLVLPLKIHTKEFDDAKEIKSIMKVFDALTISEKTILIAEDDLTSYELMKKIFNGERSVKLLYTENGDEAVKMFERNPDISLILMDLKMPVMDGFEATRRIRMKNPIVPIIAVSAYALNGDKEKAIRAGCNSYVTKPIQIKPFKEMIQQYLS